MDLGSPTSARRSIETGRFGSILNAPDGIHPEATPTQCLDVGRGLPFVNDR
jgi:hypothetical protein